MPGRRRCVVVADATSARILLAPPSQGSSAELIEHSELECCARRAHLDRRFAAALAHHVGTIVQDWPSGSVVIAAAPETLGLLREVVQHALPKGVKLKALARDYVSLSAPELAQRLDF